MFRLKEASAEHVKTMRTEIHEFVFLFFLSCFSHSDLLQCMPIILDLSSVVVWGVSCPYQYLHVLKTWLQLGDRKVVYK